MNFLIFSAALKRLLKGRISEFRAGGSGGNMEVV